MNYSIVRAPFSDLDKAPIAPIDQIPWGATFTPKAYFQGVFDETCGFYFRFTRFEKNPVITKVGNCHGVAADSCVELFLNFSPETSASYINFEMNAGGGYLFGFGIDRFGREDIKTQVMPEVSPLILEDRWIVDLFVPLETLEELYGKTDFKAGTVLKGNAYQCGSVPVHYLTWAPVQTNERDFHRPACFGTFTLL